ASTTGEVTSDRLSVTVSLPAAAVSRAADTELPGIHSAGRCPSSPGHFPMKPSTTASEPADLTPTETQWSPTGAAMELKRSARCCTWSVIDGSAMTATGCFSPTHRPLCERLDSASPKKRQRMTTPTTTTTVIRAAITPMLTPRRPASRAAGVRRRERGRWPLVASREAGEVVRRIDVGGGQVPLGLLRASEVVVAVIVSGVVEAEKPSVVVKVVVK